MLTKDKAFYRTLIALAVPIALQNLVTFCVNLADSVMVGSLGDAAVSGMYMGNQIQNLAGGEGQNIQVNDDNQNQGGVLNNNNLNNQNNQNDQNDQNDQVVDNPAMLPNEGAGNQQQPNEDGVPVAGGDQGDALREPPILNNRNNGE